jgi:phosphocarrier protein
MRILRIEGAFFKSGRLEHEFRNPSVVDINQAAASFKSSIVLRINHSKFVDVKSILGLSITLYRSHDYKLEIHGPDKMEARASMLEVFKKHHLLVQLI